MDENISSITTTDDDESRIKLDSPSNANDLLLSFMGPEGTYSEEVLQSSSETDLVNEESDKEDSQNPNCKKKSKVWEVFTKFENNGSTDVLCSLCRWKQKYNQSTGNMLCHMKEKHPSKYTANFFE